LIPNMCMPRKRRTQAPEFVLWIGSLTPVKDPLAYVDLAERLPGVQFVMVAHDHATRSRLLGGLVRERARRLPNLEVLSRRPAGELSNLYERAVAVVNTSSFEGFPNTFLEGWARGVPVVSLGIDPDGVIAREGLGAFAGGSSATAAAAIRRYAEDPEAARAAGEAGYRYVEKTHAPEVVTPYWLALVERLLRPGV
jgi:glycosyltransferase involved in cell wall biosynthesis